jgi:hypothetical protein
LQNPSTSFGDAILHDQQLTSLASTNALPSSSAILGDTGTNMVQTHPKMAAGKH